MKIKLLQFFTLLLTVLLSSFSVWSDSPVRSVSIKDGLPFNGVHDITSDHLKRIWIATASGVALYDGYEIKNIPELQGIFAGYIDYDENGYIWIMARSGKLYKVNIKTLSASPVKTPAEKISKLKILANQIWLITNKGVFFKELTSLKDDFTQLQFSEDSVIEFNTDITDIAIRNNKFYLIGNNQIYTYDNVHRQLNTIYSSPSNQKSKFRNLTYDNSRDIFWLTENNTLRSFNPTTNKLENTHDIYHNKYIVRLVYENNLLWATTRGNGVIVLDDKDNFKNLTTSIVPGYGLSDKTTIGLHVDQSDNVFVGTFSSGFNYFSKNYLYINSYNKNNIDCIQNSSNYFTHHLGSDTVYIGTYNGLIKLHNNQCTFIDLPIKSTGSSAFYAINSNNSENKVYLGTSKGLGILNENDTVELLLSDQLNISVYFIKPHKNGYLLGTYSGLYFFDPTINKISKLSQHKQLASTSITIAEKNDLGTYYFASSRGLLYLNKNNELQAVQSDSDSFLSKPILALAIIDELLYVGGEDNTLRIYNQTGQLTKEKKLTTPFELNYFSIRSINHDDSGKYIWISTDHAIFRLSKKTDELTYFDVSDGFQNDAFIARSSNIASNGHIYLGGHAGVNYFNPKQLRKNRIPPQVILSGLEIFNKPVSIGENIHGLKLEQPIENYKTLVFNHKHSIIGFKFSGVHFGNPQLNRYAYKLEGLHDDWITTDADNRTVTFTNIKPGKYLFRVKAANNHGVWSSGENNVALKITVKPAPWFSWWAYTFYALLLAIGVYSFIHFRTRAARNRAEKLEAEVNERTKEIKQQKNTIESLLDRKNELFANISHEFRTPLTLILGPLENELASLGIHRDPKHLLMIKRNANRLLCMVEQILKLASLKNIPESNKIAYSVDRLLEAIYESFQPLAKNKSIFLSLDTRSNANILALPDSLDVIIGNLVSNAIKYTPHGGNVSIRSDLEDEHVVIQVRDTGIGLNEQQKKEVFERFVRLDQTSDIAGTGIGLSIVNELVNKHAGTIDIQSKHGQGSNFIVRLPITEQKAATDNYSVPSIEHLTQTLSSTESDIQSQAEHTDPLNDKEQILIIEDNHDMRDYIEFVLGDEYQCITADRGEIGIKLAIKNIPDLVVSDIMMPGMDGYEVARKLRNNIVTSHIPLILLTAKGDVQSRIQGWNENIDDFMTKPFDEGELLSRVHNLISLRKILTHKLSSIAADTINKTTDNIPVALNKKEQAFLDKFMRLIEKMYSDMYLQKNNLIKEMHVSERQLQRKIKALTGKTPMGIVREYRLEKATHHLRDGETVTRTIELCGFNSASYFSKSFKLMYGLSPKQYQQKVNH